MKNFTLISLKIKNFKGIKNFTLEANGKDLTILGRNGSGKTTLYDAFTWLLFGRDSLNRTQFEIKPLDENGNVKQHGIEHEVEGEFLFENKPITLKRVFKEEWKKKRGSIKKTFSGHTTEYYIDDVPVKKKEYDEKINSIVSDDIFKLLTNPTYFNEYLDQKQRRKILFDMIGDLTDEEVAKHSGNRDLIQLVERLQGKDIENHKKSVRNKQKAINEELDRIPIRIDEIELNMPDVSELNEESLRNEIEKIEKEIEEKKDLISNIKSGGEVSELKRKLSDIKMELTNLKNEHESNVNDEMYRVLVGLQEKESNVQLFESKINGENQKLKFNNQIIKDLQERIEGLRKEWIEVDSRVFEHDDECTCPTCGQQLPTEKIEETRKKAEKEFNERKSNALESIANEGGKLKEQLTNLELENEKIKCNIEKYNKEIESTQKEIEKMKKSMELIENKKTDLTKNELYQNKLKEKEEIEQKLAELKLSSDVSIINIQKEIEQLESRKKDIQDDIYKFGVVQKSIERIKELEEQEKELAKEFEKLEKELYLTEEFTRAKIDLLEEQINSKFKYARFKLFEEQVNGGLKEVCETLYKGIPYNRGLNNASRINVGLDIINTLTKVYGIQVPIFIDNRESVTDLIDIDAQTISLVVDKNAKALQIYQPEEVAI
jgi:chromosome segregation ATPase